MVGRDLGCTSWWFAHAPLLDRIAGAGIVVAVLAVFVLVVVGGRPLDWGYMGGALRTLLPAWGLSILITVASFAAGLPIGFFVGWVRTLRGESFAELRVRVGRPREALPPTRLVGLALYALGACVVAVLKRFGQRVADGYVELMRGTPLFVQILFVWAFFLYRYPRLEELALLAGLLALTLNSGGYQGEIFRAGLQTVQAGQLEAARAIGLSRLGAMRHVVLPQALRLVIPPLLNEFIGLFKASALLYTISVLELTGRFKQLLNFEARVFELFVIVIFLYLAFTLTVSKLVAYLERRYQIPGLGLRATVASARRPAEPLVA